MERKAILTGFHQDRTSKPGDRRIWIVIVVFIAAFTIPGLIPGATAGNATVPGEVTTPYPTITNLAVEWLIDGDDNLDGVVRVDYRMAGETEWRAGMPLRRIPAGRSSGTRPTYRWDNKHSGSIFDLRPGTEYEIRLRLTDPDGGDEERVVKAATRPVPRPAPDGRVRQAGPRDFADLINCAEPGDIFELRPGYYGDFTVLRDGRPGRPIVIRADNSHEAIGSTFERVSLENRRHVIIDGLTVNGPVELRGAEEVAVRHCRISGRYGIIAQRQPGAVNCYIADNTVTWNMPWTRLGMGSGFEYGGGANDGMGIEMTGPGNVICHNRVSGYRDCITFMEDLWVYDQICIDVYNNDITLGLDDGIEADFAFHNCRIMRNRLTNCFMGVSSQPGLGGPNYFIRNVMYNLTHSPFKLMRGSKGDVVLHNTVIKVGDGLRLSNPSRLLFRNNLIIGGSGGGIYGRYDNGPGYALFFPGADETCDMDYNGYGTVGTPFRGHFGQAEFNSLAELKRISTEKNAVLVGMNVFAGQVEFPDPAFPEREPPDLRLAPGSAAVNAGQVIPGVNDGFSGSAPDLGAFELGQELPHYGPRPRGVDEETEWYKRHGR